MTVKRATPKHGKAGANDLAILHPERALEIAGRRISMREYGFVEGLRVAGEWAPVVTDLAALTAEGEAQLGYAALQAVFAKHADAVVALMAQACDQPRDWVAGLADGDGQTLQMAWWAVNGPFFVRRVLLELQMRMATAGLASATSTPASSAPGMAASMPSGGSPAVN